MKHEPFNESTEMYLKTISELTGKDDRITPISSLAKWLGVSTVSATEMVHRLQEQGLIEHTPYKGVQLTEDGQRMATQVIRSHRLWECFLESHLRLPWERVHELACRLEHATDAELTDALSAFLGDPQRCPHGNPVPHVDGTIEAEAVVSLDEVRPGERATIRNIHPESTLLLEHLAQHNLKPGSEITVTEIAPFDGPILVALGDESHAVGREVAGHIFVTAAEENSLEEDSFEKAPREQ
jgi:DtxR family Mn-dependent transcriptional regulator